MESGFWSKKKATELENPTYRPTVRRTKLVCGTGNYAAADKPPFTGLGAASSGEDKKKSQSKH